MIEIKRFLPGGIAAFLASIALVGCASYSSVDVARSSEKITEYMQSPQLHDIYLVKCAPFFTYSIIDTSPYCLIRIVDINANDITFTMADVVAKTPKQGEDLLTEKYLRDRYPNLDWSISQTKAFPKSMISKLRDEKQIFMIRRLSESEYLSSVAGTYRRQR